MKKKIIKTLALCVASIMLFSSMVISVAAEDGQIISINGRETKFIELFRVENGVTYFPVRLVFNDFEDQGYTVIVNPSMDYQNIRIAVVKTDFSTGEIIDRRALFVNWADEVTNDDEFKFGRLELYQYEKDYSTDPNGVNYLPTENYRRPIAMNNPLIFSDVDDNGGQRAFMSTDDINNMVRFLIDDANYSIKLK